MRTDLAQARATLEAAAGRTADLLDSIPGGHLPVQGTAQTFLAVTAHLPPDEPVRTPLILPVVEAMLPLVVNPETARGHTASYEMHARNGRRFVVRFATGCPRWNRSAVRPSTATSFFNP